MATSSSQAAANRCQSHSKWTQKVAKAGSDSAQPAPSTKWPKRSTWCEIWTIASTEICALETLAALFEFILQILTVHTHIKISVNRAKYQLHGLCVTEIHPCRQRDPSGPGAQGCNPENHKETRTPVAAWGPLFPVIPIVPITQWRMGCKHQERLKL